MKNKEEYISLYDYTGEATGQNGKGRDVYNVAKSKGIQVIYKDLPEERQRENYTRVATYPRSFLDDYFGVQTEPTATNTVDLTSLMRRLDAVERKNLELERRISALSQTVTVTDDDLPF